MNPPRPLSPDEIREDVKLVTEGLGVSILILNGALTAQPTDHALMLKAREAFNRLRAILETTA